MKIYNTQTEIDISSHIESKNSGNYFCASKLINGNRNTALMAGDEPFKVTKSKTNIFDNLFVRMPVGFYVRFESTFIEIYFQKSSNVYVYVERNVIQSSLNYFGLNYYVFSLCHMCFGAFHNFLSAMQIRADIKRR